MICFFGDGRLTKDPVLRRTTTGTDVATLSCAFHRSRKNKDGDYDTVFMDVTVWGAHAVTCANSLSKGSYVVVKGELTQRSYEDRSGNKRTVTEVNSESVSWAGESKSRSNSYQPYNGGNENQTYQPHYLDGMEEVEDNAEDLPF